MSLYQQIKDECFILNSNINDALNTPSYTLICNLLNYNKFYNEIKEHIKGATLSFIIDKKEIQEEIPTITWHGIGKIFVKIDENIDNYKLESKNENKL